MQEVLNHDNVKQEQVSQEKTLHEEEFSSEVRELVYAGVLTPVELKHEILEAQSHHQKREVITLARVYQPAADEFLATETSWGITGKEFLLQLKENLTELAKYHIRRYNEEKIYLKPQEIHEYIEQLTLNKSREQKEEVKKLLAGATDSGLLIHQESYGYYPYPEHISNFYIFNQNDQAIALLGSQTLYVEEVIIDEEKALSLFSEEILVRNPENPLRNDLTSKEFFTFFSEPKTAKEAYNNQEFYKDKKIQYQQKYVCSLFDSLLADGIASGTLIETTNGDRVSYVLSPKIKSIL